MPYRNSQTGRFTSRDDVHAALAEKVSYRDPSTGRFITREKFESLDEEGFEGFEEWELDEFDEFEEEEYEGGEQ